MKADNCAFKSYLMIFHWLDEFCWYFCLTAAQWTNMPITSTPSMNGHKNSRELSRVVALLCSVAQESEPVYSIISVLFFHDEQQQESSYSNPPTNISVWDHPYVTSAYFWTFSNPPTHYVSSTIIVLNIFKNCHFVNQPTQTFCWRNIGMVPIWPASKKSPCNPEFLMKLDAHSGSSLCIFLFGENIYHAIFTLFFQNFWFLVACNFPTKCIFNNTLRK